METSSSHNSPSLPAHTNSQFAVWAVPHALRSMRAALRLLLLSSHSSSSSSGSSSFSSHSAGFLHPVPTTVTSSVAVGSLLQLLQQREFLSTSSVQLSMAAALFGFARSRPFKALSMLSQSLASNMATGSVVRVCGLVPKQQQQLSMGYCSSLVNMANRSGRGRFLFSRALSSSSCCMNNPWPGFVGLQIDRFGARRREIVKLVDTSGRRAFRVTPRAEAQGGRASVVAVVVSSLKHSCFCFCFGFAIWFAVLCRDDSPSSQCTMQRTAILFGFVFCGFKLMP